MGAEDVLLPLMSGVLMRAPILPVRIYWKWNFMNGLLIIFIAGQVAQPYVRVPKETQIDFEGKSAEYPM